ncbi:STAS/SEC14 domain-containing protein [Synechococcus sp. CCY 9618]|uniref:STAS/SEC14 domain-containing protein n=1 Tax=Synechococcus sp. CCY 9618 TaxID=2815602 RepID=UPI0020B41D3E|nr:STAS/SEC14 domain-containing protein [Synechococcus sp. CCY 9618]
MIDTLQGLPDGTLGFRMRGTITAADYANVLTPALEHGLEQHDRLKLLVIMGEDFEAYELGAAWEDSKEALRHWSGFERLALVTEVPWLRLAMQAFAVALPCPSRLFANSEVEDARRWLGESLGTIHLSREGALVTARLIGSLEASAFERAEQEIDALFSGIEGVRLLLDLRQFDGWAGLGALGQHLALIRDHRHALRRVAVVGDAAWQKLAERVVSRLLPAKARFFPAADFALAETWLNQ